jgi:7-cyano-7-deazaguanine synthase
MKKSKNAIVLCSGGIDSVTTAYHIKRNLKYSRMIILFFSYAQRSLKSERKCARICARKLGADFIEIELNWLGKISSSIINKKIKTRKLSRKVLKNTKKESEKYYVPCRNTIFLAYAMALAESIFMKNKENYDIFVGFKNEGKESYPDTTERFIGSINKLGRMCYGNSKIIAPLIKKDKEDIILLGNKLGVNFNETHSCYVKNRHCGRCLACMLRKEGFYWANVQDGTSYA